jgi:hypothetical protein
MRTQSVWYQHLKVNHRQPRKRPSCSGASSSPSFPLCLVLLRSRASSSSRGRTPYDSSHGSLLLRPKDRGTLIIGPKSTRGKGTDGHPRGRLKHPNATHHSPLLKCPLPPHLKHSPLVVSAAPFGLCAAVLVRFKLLRAGQSTSTKQAIKESRRVT